MKRWSKTEPIDCNGRWINEGDKVKSTPDLCVDQREGVVLEVGPVWRSIPMPNCVVVRTTDGKENMCAASLWEVVE